MVVCETGLDEDAIFVTFLVKDEILAIMLGLSVVVCGGGGGGSEVLRQEMVVASVICKVLHLETMVESVICEVLHQETFDWGFFLIS